MNIEGKIQSYKKAYYKQQAVRVALFWGLLYLIFLGFAVFLEYNFWFSENVRAILFGLLIVGLAGYLCFGIWMPIRRFRLKGNVMSNEEAAKRIGRSLTGIEDKLLNYLQLSNRFRNTEEVEGLFQPEALGLLGASIDQKVSELGKFVFTEALDWQKYGLIVKRFAMFLVVLTGIYISQAAKIQEGLTRVVKFQEKFVPRAPFILKLISENRVVSGQALLVECEVKGNKLPEEIEVLIFGQWVKMQQKSLGRYLKLVENCTEDFELEFRGGGYLLGSYPIKVVHSPSWEQIKIRAQYPKHLKLEDGEIPFSNNLIIPEGTHLRFEFATRYSTGFSVYESGKWIRKIGVASKTVFQKQVAGNFDLKFALLGEFGLKSDTLVCGIEAIKDMYPSIEVEAKQDSLQLGVWYFGGVATDDYGVVETKVIFRGVGKGSPARDTQWRVQTVWKGLSVTSPVAFTMDTRMQFSKNTTAVEYYFTVKDNDGFHGGKVTKTDVRKLQLVDEMAVLRNLEKQEAGVGKGMNSSMKTLKELQKEAGKLQQELNSKQGMEWEQENKIDKFVKDQQKMLNTMKQLQQKQEKLNEQKKNLDPSKMDIQQKKDEISKQMKNLVNPEMQKLLDELNRLLQQKADKEQIQDKMDQIKSANRESAMEMEKLMEQLKNLELEEAVDLQVKAIDDWIKKQEALEKQTQGAKKDELLELKKEQESLNNELKEIQKGLQDIDEKNKALEKPMELKTGMEKQKEAESEAQKAAQNLGEQKKSAASENQKKSAQKMKEAMQQLQESFQKEQNKRAAEDYQTLRNLLENLIEISRRQEAHFVQLKQLSAENPRMQAMNREQMQLRESWKFLEDSLQALSKRQAAISQFVTKEMNKVNFSMEEALQALRVRNNRKAAMNEQFVMTGMNNLAEMLIESLQSMQQQMQQNQQKQQGNQSCNNPNNSGNKSGKPKPGGKLSEEQKKLGEMLQQMQQQKNGQQGAPKPGDKQGNKPQNGGNQSGGEPQKEGNEGEQRRKMSEELAKMALMQEQLRRQVEQLRQELGGNGNAATNKLLKETENLMEQQEKDIVNGKINQQNVERQKQIMTRLLEHEKADRKQDQEEQRESNRGRAISVDVPAEIQAEVELKVKEKEQLHKVQPGFNAYYKQAAGSYLRKTP